MSVVVKGKRGPVRPDALNVLRGQQTRARILGAARTRILTHGFEALRLDELARDAGITKAAVIKSAGGKASILLTLGDEDRQTRLQVIREATTLRTGLRRRIHDLARRLLELDLARLNVVMAYIGYMWFWTGADHERAQAMLDETRASLEDVFASASTTPLSPDRLNVLALRMLSSYVIGLRDLRYGRKSLDEAARLVAELVLDERQE